MPPRDPRMHPALPAVTYQGGRQLHKVEVVTVVWGNDPLAADLATFAKWLDSSGYYDEVDQAYSLSHGTASGPFAIPDPPPALLKDSAVGPLLRDQIAKKVLPPPGPDTLYVLYLPPGVKSTNGGGETGCQQYDGYHWWASTGMDTPKKMPYAVIPACHGDEQFQWDTYIATHEITEAMTDPEPPSGYLIPGQIESEVADLCSPLFVDWGAPIGDGGTTTYRLARFWSIKNAQAGDLDPCVPIPPEPYHWFNAAIDPSWVDVPTPDTGATKINLLITPFAYGSVGKISWDLWVNPSRGISLSASHGSGYPGSQFPVTLYVAPTVDSGPHTISIFAHANGAMNVWYANLSVL